MDDRRQHPRSNVDWRVKFAAPGDEPSNGYLSDVSASGANILCGNLYPAGTRLTIYFGAFQENPDRGFELVAVVRHAGRGKVGVEFLDGPVTDPDRLHYFLRGIFRTE